ncbi:AbgT family transporter [Tissierellaceae bacterium HCP3S3_D8]
MTGDEIGNSFAKGLSGMAFVVFVIGMARVVSLVMNEGQIIHTIVYNLTRPIMNLNRGLSAIGITTIIALINPIIPSASSKAAILIPIIKPITEALDMTPQIAISAFQYGDGFTNIISPALGWTIGSAAVAKVPFQKWVKWSMPIVIIMIILSFGWIFMLNAIGWTGL